MNLLLKQTIVNKQSTIKITGSKSETNRLLLLQALYTNITIENTSNSDDSRVMIQALKSQDTLIDVHHAGTTMRFLTAFFAIQEGREVTLTGSNRMKERPIKILVDALRQLGADISYEEKDGFPPLKIIGKKLKQNKVSLPANVSSQYISALLLIAPKLENGLELTLEGEITSIPYIKMTCALLESLGITTRMEGSVIQVDPAPQVAPKTLVVESDWSSASYYYSIIALSKEGTQIELSSFKENSLQGDAILATIYEQMGVETHYKKGNITLIKNSKIINQNIITLS